MGAGRSKNANLSGPFPIFNPCGLNLGISPFGPCNLGGLNGLGGLGGLGLGCGIGCGIGNACNFLIYLIFKYIINIFVI